ncbi:MAG: RNA polymerase sigma factor, partial [Pseudomonadota bacterium]|nr:RNA polymerase sigma factor [Pseudomonadota bacterium]
MSDDKNLEEDFDDMDFDEGLDDLDDLDAVSDDEWSDDLDEWDEDGSVDSDITADVAPQKKKKGA